MQTSFFIALISLAVFAQAAPAPQLPLGAVTGVLGGLPGVGSVLGGGSPPAGGAGGAGGAEARAVDEPLAIWKRQVPDPSKLVGAVGVPTSLLGTLTGGATPGKAQGGSDEA